MWFSSVVLPDPRKPASARQSGWAIAATATGRARTSEDRHGEALVGGPTRHDFGLDGGETARDAGRGGSCSHSQCRRVSVSAWKDLGPDCLHTLRRHGSLCILRRHGSDGNECKQSQIVRCCAPWAPGASVDRLVFDRRMGDKAFEAGAHDQAASYYEMVSRPVARVALSHWPHFGPRRRSTRHKPMGASTEPTRLIPRRASIPRTSLSWLACTAIEPSRAR
jgi:hypothetical protein